MKEAIKKAKEGGWKPQYVKQFWTFGWEEMSSGLNQEDRTYELTSIFLDPLFWQALGKAEGWDKQGRYAMTHWSCDGILDTRPWFNIMMNFMSQVIGEGKDINSFFELLLTKSTPQDIKR